MKTPIEYKIVYKGASRFMFFLNFFVKRFCPTFMSKYTTTIGSKIYTPNKSLHVNHNTLIHELQHIYDSKKFPILYEISYLLLLPMFFTFRSIWEKRANYWNQLNRYYEAENKELQIGIAISHLQSRFCEWDYLKMHYSKKKIKKWYLKMIEESTHDQFFIKKQEFLKQFKLTLP